MKVTVLGGGSWGLTLAILLFKKGIGTVTVYECDRTRVEEMIEQRENRVSLPGIRIPEQLKITDDLGDSVTGAELMVWAIPSRVYPLLSREVASLNQTALSVIVSKGFSAEGERLSETLCTAGIEKIVVLSGPSHAEEVSRGIPTAVVAASNDSQLTLEVQKVFSTEYLRVYTNSDMVGVELGGALKNILALACGISDGLGFGDNSKAALITRGLSEMVRFGVSLGGKKETFYGLAGIGDLIVTAMSRHSRNRRFGEEVGRGKSSAQILREMKMVAEGYYTVQGVYRSAQRLGVEIPITEEVYRILYEDKSPRDAVLSLMSRDARPEWE